MELAASALSSVGQAVSRCDPGLDERPFFSARQANQTECHAAPSDATLPVPPRFAAHEHVQPTSAVAAPAMLKATDRAGRPRADAATSSTSASVQHVVRASPA